MKKSLLIIGAGTFATEVEEIARLLGFDNVAFIDDNPDNAVAWPVVGGINDLNSFVNKYPNAIVAMGNNVNRLKLHNLLETYGYNIPTLIHPMAYISPDAKLASGCIVRAMSVVGRYAKLEKAVILNLGAKVDHHCVIGEGSHLLINSVVRASKTLSPLTWLDSNQVIQ